MNQTVPTVEINTWGNTNKQNTLNTILCSVAKVKQNVNTLRV